jgi:3-dehydroquinate synthase
VVEQDLIQIDVDLGSRSYPILIKDGLLDQSGNLLRQLNIKGKIFILTDEHVNAFYGDWLERCLQEAGFQTKRLVLPPGEATKSFETLPEIYQALLDFRMTRQDVVLTLGGGVIGDLGGFAAATYLRGIPYIQIPTTLLAQVDSSVGGKVGVDLPAGKNLVGSFHQPAAVIIDPHVLQTLPERYMRDGMAEVIKYGCICDAALFEQLEKDNSRILIHNIPQVIANCCRIKKQIVEVDERDQGNRMLLNFGHTIGHAIEAVERYQGHSHGEAVAIGMTYITQISEAKGLTKAGTVERIVRLLNKHGLPTAWQGQKATDNLVSDNIVSAMAVDKKTFGSILKVILLEDIGKAYIYETNVDFFRGLA